MSLRRGMVLVLGSVLLVAACGSDPAPGETNGVVSPLPGVSATTTIAPTTTLASPVVSTTTDWVPVGGSELYDSQTSHRDDQTSTPAIAHSSPRFQNLLQDVDEAEAGGDLTLGKVDRLWSEALSMIHDRQDVSLVGALMKRLATARDGVIADPPSPLIGYEELLVSALVDREPAARLELYQLLDDLIATGLMEELDYAQLDELQYALADEVGAAAVRLEALASGRVGPELDPGALPALPDRVLLVQWSNGYNDGDVIVLVDLDGTPIGYLDHQSLKNVTIADGRLIPMQFTPPVDDPDEECLVSWSDSESDYLICNDATSFARTVLRGEIRVRHQDGSEERLAGGPDYGDELPVGQWVSVVPSPDRSVLLGQWSDACQIPSAHLIYNGDVSESLGRVGTSAPESYALGWREDGVALISLTTSACSNPVGAGGVYTVVPGADPEPLYVTTTGAAVVRLVESAAAEG